MKSQAFAGRQADRQTGKQAIKQSWYMKKWLQGEQCVEDHDTE